MKKIKTIKVYNLVDSKGNKLALELGSFDPSYNEEYPISTSDKGYRWRFIGKHIPMPVRSLYWFNGFPEETMIEWLKGNGWYPRTCVDMGTGYAKVYELPKGNDEDIRITPYRHDHEECVFRNIICNLAKQGKNLQAAILYRYANGGDIYAAKDAVREIIDNHH